MTQKRKKMMTALVIFAALLLLMSMTVFAAAEEAPKPHMYATFWSLIPPVVAIALALITKEVYSSLFVGILVGALFSTDFQFEGTVLKIIDEGFIQVLSDSSNVGILIFLVILGTMVCMMNRAGGSAGLFWKMGRKAHQNQNRCPDCHHYSGNPDFCRRLFQLFDCGKCNAPRNRQAQCFQGQICLSD